MSNKLILILLALLPAGLPVAEDAAAQKKAPTTQTELRQANKPPVIPTVDLKLAAPELTAVYIMAANGDATTVVSGSNLYFQLALAGDPPTHYRMSTVNGFPGADWKAMSPRSGFVYALPSSAQTDGPKTLRAQVMNDAGMSQVVSAPFEYLTLRPDLDPSVAQSSADVYAGQNMTYTVTVQNSGAAAAGAVTADSFLPEGLDYISHSAPADFSCQYQSGQKRLRCTGGTIATGQAATISIVAKLALSSQAGHLLLFETAADPENQIAESSETNNTAAAATTIVEAPLVNHLVPGADAVSFSSDHGYAFLAAALDQQSECFFVRENGEYHLQFETAAFLSISKPVVGRCRFDFFSDKPLNSPWKLAAVALAADPMPPGKSWHTEWIDDPKLLTDDPHFSLKVEAGPVYGRVLSITLTGPTGADWRNAFQN